jgi:hypothetical protein
MKPVAARPSIPLGLGLTTQTERTPMDERQAGIKEGAGLSESRVNEELLDFLRKYSTPFFIVIIAVSLAWLGFKNYQQRQVAATDAAYAALSATAESADTPSPAALRAVASEHAGIGSVSLLAELRLADLYLESVRRGLVPGAEVEDDGLPKSEDDVLTEDDRARYLDDAAGLYQKLITATKGDDLRALIEINGHFGLAAVAESRGEIDEARGHYEAAASRAKAVKIAGLDTVAEQRIASLETVVNPPALLELSALPVLPGEPPRPGETPEGDAAEDTATDATDADSSDAPEVDGEAGEDAAPPSDG